MNKDDFYFYHENQCKKMLDISKRKGADYCGESSSDPFFNFRQVETLGICSVEQGFLTRMTDKMSRISSLIKQEAHVKDESIEDTLLDLANYSILLSAYLKSKNKVVPIKIMSQVDQNVRVLRIGDIIGVRDEKQE